MSRYDPFTYSPMLRAYYVTSNFPQDRAPVLPASAVNLAAQRPELANHINSIWSFLSWMQTSSPDLYNMITNKRPDLVDPATVVQSGALSPADKGKTPAAKSTLKGMGDDTTAATPSTPPATDWGQSILDTIKSVAPAYFQVKSQNDLMKINVQRAEQGLPAIDSSTLAPTVNVGVSPGVQTLMYVGLGGLVLVGLLQAFKKK